MSNIIEPNGKRIGILAKPTLSNVVIAYVAMPLLESVIKFSISTLQVATLPGWTRAKALSVRIAANFRVDFGDDKKS